MAGQWAVGGSGIGRRTFHRREECGATEESCSPLSAPPWLPVPRPPPSRLSILNPHPRPAGCRHRPPRAVASCLLLLRLLHYATTHATTPAIVLPLARRSSLPLPAMPSGRSRGSRPGVWAGGGGARVLMAVVRGRWRLSEPIAHRCSALYVHRQPARRACPCPAGDSRGATRCPPARQFTSPGAEISAPGGQNSPPRCQFFNVCNGWQKMRGALPPVPAQGGASVAQGRGTPPLVRTTEAPRSAATSAPPARSARRR